VLKKSFLFTISNEFFITITALLGIVALIFVTRHGIGIYPDSIFYLDAARNFLKGHGLSTSFDGLITPLTHFPPFYPLLLASIGSTGINLLDGARWLSAFLLGANIFLVGFIINHYCPKPIWLSIFSSLLMLSSGAMLEIHSLALTEPLFIFLSFLGLFLLALYVEKNKFLILISSALVIGLAFLTRYIGLTLIITGTIGIYLSSQKSQRDKIIDCLIFASISVSFGLGWSLRNLILTGMATDRTFLFHPVEYDQIRDIFDTFSFWLLPEGVSFYLGRSFLFTEIVGLLVFVSLILGLKLKQRKAQFISFLANSHYFLTFLLIFIFVYESFLLISVSFFDSYTAFDNRILSPLYVCFLLILGLMSKLLAELKSKNFSRFILGIAFICICSHLFYEKDWITINSSDGLVYASKAWQESATMIEIKSLPAEVSIFSNDYAAIYFITGRHATKVPYKLNPFTQETNETFSAELAALKTQVERKKAVVVYFAMSEGWYWYAPDETELAEKLALPLLLDRSDGTIYGLAK